MNPISFRAGYSGISENTPLNLVSRSQNFNYSTRTFASNNDSYTPSKKADSDSTSHTPLRRRCKRFVKSDKVIISKGTLAVIGALCAALGSCATTKVHEINSKTMPEDFDYVQVELENTPASNAEYAGKLYSKSDAQHQVATSFRDGDFVYYIIDLKNGNDGISAADFKELFDIEDEVLKEYNYLGGETITTESTFGDRYSTYNHDAHIFHTGDVVKVPRKAIAEDDIDVDSY